MVIMIYTDTPIQNIWELTHSMISKKVFDRTIHFEVNKGFDKIIYSQYNEKKLSTIILKHFDFKHLLY